MDSKIEIPVCVYEVTRDVIKKIDRNEYGAYIIKDYINDKYRINKISLEENAIFRMIDGKFIYEIPYGCEILGDEACLLSEIDAGIDASERFYEPEDIRSKYCGHYFYSSLQAAENKMNELNEEKMEKVYICSDSRSRIYVECGEK